MQLKKRQESIFSVIVNKASLAEVKSMLASDPYLIHKRDTDGRTILHIAAATPGCEDMVKLLLESGADINAGDYPDTARFYTRLMTPLHRAVCSSSKSCVEVLLAAGADLHTKNDMGETPLHLAAEYGYTEIAELLLTYDANVDETDNEGKTALHKAHNRDTAELLIAGGANVNAKAKDGSSPLHRAVEMVFEKRPMVELLLASGADVNAQNDEGDTPLHISTRQEDRIITEILLQNRADPCVKNKLGKTPLDILFHCHNEPAWGYEPIRRLLWRSVRSYITAEASTAEAESILNAYPDFIKEKDAEGCTLLHAAVLRGREDIAQVLITAGADVNQKDNLGNTPLQWAIKLCRAKAVKLLRDHKAEK